MQTTKVNSASAAKGSEAVNLSGRENPKTPTLAEQKQQIRDCLEKVAYIRQEMARLFPRVTFDRNPGYTPIEKSTLDVYQNDMVSASNSLSDIYGNMIGQEVSHD